MPRLPIVIALCLIVSCVPRKRTPEQEKQGAPPKAEPTKPTSRANRRSTRRASKTRKIPKPTKANRATAGDERPDPRLTQPLSDNFDRDELGANWRATSPRWRLEDGRLCGQGARNHPIWLRRRLPKNARIEFDAVSYSSDGDIKAEFWGDGRSASDSVSYTNATSYLTIFGGWKNQFHVLARIDEHAPNRPEIKIDPELADLKSRPVEKGVEYHFKVERNDGHTVRWLVDDLELFAFKDDDPLVGAGHEHFGFNDWDVRVCFDNLRVTPLKP